MPNSESDKRGDAIASLPYHILMDEILPRFPVNSLIRFKSVSKHWNSTISSYNFAKLRLKFNNSSDNFFVINPHSSDFCEFGRFFNLLPQNEHTCVNELFRISANVFTDTLFSFFELVGCCDGLVCFEYPTLTSSVFCVWNPTTHEYREVGNPGSVNIAWCYGFGYVSSLNDYRIVSSFGKNGTNKCDGFYEFLLREGKWKRMGDFDEHICWTRFALNPVWIDGIVFWTTKYCCGDIIMLNSETKEFKVYPMTKWLNTGYYKMDLYPLQGSLALHRLNVNGNSNFWVLKKLDDLSSWEELFTVNLFNIFFVGLFENGKCLLRRYDQFRLVDLSKEALECAKGGFIGQGFDTNRYVRVGIASYTKSLVSPFGTTKLDGAMGVETENYEV